MCSYRLNSCSKYLWVYFLLLLLPSTIVKAQIIATYAGIGPSGSLVGSYSGDGGSATLAGLSGPGGIAVDTNGNLYINDHYNYRYRKVNAAGIISTTAGTGLPGYSGDGGPATNAELLSSGGNVVDRYGNVLIVDATFRARMISTAGIITTFAGNGTNGFTGDGGPATAAEIGPNCIATDGSGNIYITTLDNRIRKIDTSGIITTVAGSGTSGDTGDGGPATAAEIAPLFITCGPDGNIYLTNEIQIRMINTAGIISTIAGNGITGFSGDGGPATAAEFGGIGGLAIDKSGNLFVADAFNHRVRMIKTSGTIYSIAGNGIQGFAGDGGPADSAEMNRPAFLTIGNNGNVYITDWDNNRIRTITLPTISITSSGRDTICAGTSVLFTASVLNDAITPIYHWQVNHINAGSDTSVYVTDTLHNGDTISCVLSYVFGDSVTKTSDFIIMTVDSFPPVAAAITGVDSLCKRFAATLNESVAGGIWRSSNANASVAAGVVTGTNIGMDTIIYKITNGCGVDSVTKTINIKDCSAGLANLSSSQMMNVWPNPNDGTFTLYLPEAINEPLQITITNMLGEKIKALTGQTNMTLDINLDAAAGVYFLSVNTIEGIGNTKVIVTK